MRARGDDGTKYLNAEATGRGRGRTKGCRGPNEARRARSTCSSPGGCARSTTSRRFQFQVDEPAGEGGKILPVFHFQIWLCAELFRHRQLCQRKAYESPCAKRIKLAVLIGFYTHLRNKPDRAAVSTQEGLTGCRGFDGRGCSNPVAIHSPSDRSFRQRITRAPAAPTSGRLRWPQDGVHGLKTR